MPDLDIFDAILDDARVLLFSDRGHPNFGKVYNYMQRRRIDRLSKQDFAACSFNARTMFEQGSIRLADEGERHDMANKDLGLIVN